MAEVVKHGGDVNGALGELGGKSAPTTLDLTKLREIARNASTQDTDSSKKYNIKD